MGALHCLGLAPCPIDPTDVLKKMLSYLNQCRAYTSTATHSEGQSMAKVNGVDKKVEVTLSAVNEDLICLLIVSFPPH